MIPHFSPKAPPEKWLSYFLQPSLLQAKSYQLDAPKVLTKLDQNESPFDWPADFKSRVLATLAQRPWNRYPNPYPTELAQMVANDTGLSSEKQLLLGPGSNYLITLLMDALCHRPNVQVVIARPSFPLYENHAAYSGVAYTPWDLNSDLEYDPARLPSLLPGSVVLFASPNNPVGNSLPSSDLRLLLQSNPDTLFVADEAYFEFSNDPYTALLKSFHNLVIIRTFSKALGAAGVRLGYIMGSEPLINEVRKLRLPYLLNQFSLVAATAVMENADMRQFFSQSVNLIKVERDRVFAKVTELARTQGFSTKPTQANFLLLRWSTTEASTAVYRGMVERGVLVRNVAGAPGMGGCLRATISTREENDLFLGALRQSI